MALLHSFYNENSLEYFLTHMREHLPFAGVLPCESSRAQMSRGPRQPGPFPAGFFPRCHVHGPQRGPVKPLHFLLVRLGRISSCFPLTAELCSQPECASVYLFVC